MTRLARRRRPDRARRLLAALLLIATTLPFSPEDSWAQANGPVQPAAIAEVRVDNFTFSPATLTVPKGTTVSWVNEDDIPHAIAATDRLFRSKALDTTDRFTFTFTSAGEYAYFCSLHPHMTGRIVVTP